MNNKLDEDIDLKIKEILKEDDDVIVPEKISNGINEILKELNYEKSKSLNKVTLIASIGVIILFVLFTPLGVEAIKAIKEAMYTYIPSIGTTINSDDTIYTLENPITKSIDKRIITVTEVFYNVQNKTIMVDVEGNGQLPENKAILKIKNKKIKSYEANINKIGSTDRNISWTGTLFFKYSKPYNNENIEFEIVLDNGTIAQLDCNLKETKHVTDITELGPTATNGDITITAVVDENESILSINLLDNLKERNIGLTYGGWQEYDVDDNMITLTDVDNKVVKGKFTTNYSNLLDDNKIKFDIEGLKKPFKITIPNVSAYMHNEVSSSEIIELPIPKNNEELIIDKDIELKINDSIVEGSNTKVKIVSINKEFDECTIELQYPGYKDNEIQLEGCVIVPAGKSVSSEAQDWFEDGLSGSWANNGIKWTFKLPYPDADKLFIKVRGSDYKFIGPWEIIIE